MPTTPDKQISNCCKAPFHVEGSDEGTNHYECDKCGNSCDPFVPGNKNCRHSSIVSCEPNGNIGFCAECGDSVRVKEVCKKCDIEPGNHFFDCPLFDQAIEKKCHLNYSGHICNENHCTEIDCLKCKGLEEKKGCSCGGKLPKPNHVHTAATCYRY